MFGISFEHLIILAVVLLIFGPRRLPELGNTMGKAIRNFKDALNGVEEAKYRRIEEPAAPQKTLNATTATAAAPAAQPEHSKTT